MWFEDLMGFAERDPDQVRSNIELRGDRLVSRVNGRSFGCGRLETPSLAELRGRLGDARSGPVRLREAVGDVRAMHSDPRNAGALFQAASQFNLLEMVGPNVTPEQGVGIYENDRTQGPACAIACGAGTIYRNYFAPVVDRVGQCAEHQIDCLADLGRALGNDGSRLWKMRNGYALLEPEGLASIGAVLGSMSADELDALRGLLRIGVHSDVEVTLERAGHRVTQVYGSALPVSYGQGRTEDWEPFARLVLEASYEATLCAAALNATATGNPTVFLTTLGGGAFGNPDEWIFPAIERAIRLAANTGLDVAVVSYGRSKAEVRALTERCQQSAE